MSMALVSKNKLSFVDSMINAPEAIDPLYPVWKRCNNMVLSWIHRSIAYSIINLIMWMKRTSDVWNDLKQHFAQSSVFRIAEILEDVFRLQQGDRSISDYFTELKSLWDELETLQPLPACRCVPSCTCGAMVEVRATRERIQVIRLLKELNEQFIQVRSQIMLMEPLPDLNKVFALVSQQERQINSNSQVDMFAESKVFISNRAPTRGSFSQRRRGRNTKLCTHCGKVNHTVDTCFEKHGYPPGYKT
ncbi:uncharacterized protein LOC133314771 [Gastrolobium bilobum]|uniref:uncharacterized protein LOC133314771 n=1 Tax=Gastrolobium bilobum TaxID=150636 RepID=UPI002AAFE7D6|nr:uncharacterized protein LOC133314771 [Gastrolobium bilobum]